MTERPPVTCHVLDTTTGKPAENILCSIYQLNLVSSNAAEGDEEITEVDLKLLAMARTNSDGRVAQWTFSADRSQAKLLAGSGIIEQNASLEWKKLIHGTYKIRFQVGKYYESIGQSNFHPFIDIIFKVEDSRHYHIPLLLSNYGYTTYRGS